MSRKLLTLLLGLPLVFSVRDLLAKDTKVALHLVNGKQIVGLLHSVSDSSIKVLVYVGVGESAREVKHGEIRSIEVISRPKLLVFLKNGQHISGELGAVTDSLLALQKTKILVQSNNESAHDQSQAEIAVHEIQEVVIQGSPNIGRGMGRGALIGALTGVAIGALAESSSNEDPFVGAGVLHYSAE